MLGHSDDNHRNQLGHVPDRRCVDPGGETVHISEIAPHGGKLRQGGEMLLEKTSGGRGTSPGGYDKTSICRKEPMHMKMNKTHTRKHGSTVLVQLPHEKLIAGSNCDGLGIFFFFRRGFPWEGEASIFASSPKTIGGRGGLTVGDKTRTIAVMISCRISFVA